MFKTKLLMTFLFANLPFILVWMAYFMTFFAFSANSVFNSNMFWGLSVIYWLLFLCLLGLIWED